MSSGTKVLVTGGAGFIGSHLVDALALRGDRVVVLDDLSTGRRENIDHLLAEGVVELVEGSTSDAVLVNDLVASADVCFHLASAVGVELVVNQPLDSLLRNVRGVDNVTEAAHRHDCRLLFVSTSEVYGKHSDGALPEDADRLLGPPSISRWTYATAKALGEMLAFQYARERGAEMAVVRLFNTVGPRQTGAYGMVVPRLVRQALAGDPLTVHGDGSQSRCFTHVLDVVDAILRLAERDEALGRAYNIGSPDEVTILGLARRIIERTGSSAEVRFVPYEVAYGDGFEELGRRQPDTTAIAHLTGWRATRGLGEIIDDVAAYERDALGVPTRHSAAV